MKEEIKKLIIDIVNSFEDRALNGFTAFPEFKKIASGDLQWNILTEDGRETNIVILVNVNEDCILAFSELKDSGVIDLKQTDVLVALIDGSFYKIPLAKSIKVYKSLRWLPTIVKKGINFPKGIPKREFWN